METPTLTKDQVLRAERREGYTHPVISLLERRAPEITDFHQAYRHLKDSQDQQRLVEAYFGFLADDFGSLPDFTLAPLELVAIWSKAHEMMGYYERKVGLGMVLPTSYSIKGIQNPAWKKFPRLMLQEYKLPQEVEIDREGLLHARERVNQVKANLDEVRFYMHGVRNGTTRAADLALKAYREGDNTARKELDRLVAYSKEHQTRLLLELGENLGSGVTLTLMKLNEFLKQNKSPDV